MTGHDALTAGTVGANYLVPRAPHRFDPAPADWGERSRCRSCDRERHQHLPAPRRADDRTEHSA